MFIYASLNWGLAGSIKRKGRPIGRPSYWPTLLPDAAALRAPPLEERLLGCASCLELGRQAFLEGLDVFEAHPAAAADYLDALANPLL